MNWDQLLRDHARLRGGDAAIIDTVNGCLRTLSFAELNCRVNQVAALLVQSGLRVGDRVFVGVPMSLELYVTLLALLKLGLAAVLFEPSLGKAEFERRLRALHPAGLIAGRRACLIGAAASSEIRRIPVKIVLGAGVPGTRNWYDARKLVPHTAYAPISADTPAIITLTSGSTGVCKAGERTHDFLRAQYEAIQSNLGLRAGSVEFLTLPLFALANLAAGATSVLPDTAAPRPADLNPMQVVGQIEGTRAGRILVPPALLAKLLDFRASHTHALRRVEQVFTGGGPAFPGLIDRFDALMPHAVLHMIYGATEAEPIAAITSAQIDASDRAAMRRGAGLLAGYPVPQIQCRILAGDPAGNNALCTGCYGETALAAAHIRGEVIVAGPHVLPRYLDPDANRLSKVGVGGTLWHRTGDAGVLDDRGRLWLLGRCAASDGRVYPFEVEARARECPGVTQAAFTSVNGRGVLAVQPHSGATPRSRASLVRMLQNLPVDEVKLLRRIPMDIRHASKVDYPALTRKL